MTRTHGGFVVVAAPPVETGVARVYRGLDGHLPWPIELGEGDRRAFGLGDGAGTHELATDAAPLRDYLALCREVAPSSRVVLVESGDCGVPWDRPDDGPALLGHDLVDLTSFFSALWEELIVVLRHPARWRAALNPDGLFRTESEVRRFSVHRDAALAEDPRLERHAHLRVVALREGDAIGHATRPRA